MALQKFRDKQKIIYWIVAIIVIPSFMIFGYSQVFDYNSENSTIGVIDKKEYSYQEFTDFYKRIQAVNFGKQVYFTWDGQYPQLSGSEAMFQILALRDSAVKYGLIVTDEEIATYIRGLFNYSGNNEKELEKLIENALEQTSRLKSVYEYKIGVRDWLLAKKFLNLVDNSIFFPSSLADLFNTMQNTTYTYGRLDIPLSDFSKEAKAEIEGLSEEDLAAKAKEFISTFQTPSSRSDYPFLWTDAKWQIEYITVPLVVEGLEQEATDEDIALFYKDNASRYQDKDGKQQELAEVKEQVKKDYISGQRAKNASNTLGSEYDRFLSRMAQKGDSSDTVIQKVSLKDIASDPRLTARGVSTGISGDTGLTAFEIADNKVFTGSGIQYMLASLDYQFQAAKYEDEMKGNNEATQKLLDDYSKTFRGFIMGQQEIPLRSKDNITKIRLVKYEPGEPRKLGDKDNADLLASITEALIKNKTDEKAEKVAEAAKSELKANKREIDGREVTTEESTFPSLAGDLNTLKVTPIGETVGPVFDANELKYSVYIVYSKDIAQNTSDSSNRMSAELLSTYYRGNSLYSPEFLMTPVIKIGARLATYMHSQDNSVFFSNK